MTQLNFHASRRKFFHFHPTTAAVFPAALRAHVQPRDAAYPKTLVTCQQQQQHEQQQPEQQPLFEYNKKCQQLFSNFKTFHFFYSSFFLGVTQLIRFPRCEIVFQCTHRGCAGVKLSCVGEEEEAAHRMFVFAYL